MRMKVPLPSTIILVFFGPLLLKSSQLRRFCEITKSLTWVCVDARAAVELRHLPCVNVAESQSLPNPRVGIGRNDGVPAILREIILAVMHERSIVVWSTEVTRLPACVLLEVVLFSCLRKAVIERYHMGRVFQRPIT